MTDTPNTTDDDSTDTEPAASDLPRGNPYVDFASSLALALGLGALGLGTAFHISLISVQAAVIDSAQIPLSMQAPDLYPVLQRLQLYANTSLYAAAVLLVGGGVLGERHQLRESLRGLPSRLEDTGGDDAEVNEDA